MKPMRLVFSSLEKSVIMRPMNAMRAKIADTSSWNPPMSARAEMKAVIVVPMLAPMIIDAACVRVIRPILTKPTTITVVADELWIIAVIAVPVPMPTYLFFVALPMRARILLPAAFSMLELKISMPIMKTVMPPSR